MGRNHIEHTDETEDIDYLEQVVNIDAIQLDDHFRKVPAELAYFNERYADAVHQYLRAKATYEATRADVYRQIRIEAEASGGKMTEALLSARVEGDERYQTAKIKHIDAESKKQRFRGRVEAVHAKKDMLISLGAHIRAEMSDPMSRVKRENEKLYPEQRNTK